MTRIYKQAVQQALLYGMFLKAKKYTIVIVLRAQGNFLKAAIDISKSSRTTLLLDGLEIHKIHKHILIQELGLLKSDTLSTSRTRSFYKCLIDLFAGNRGDRQSIKATHYYSVYCQRLKNITFPFVQCMCSGSHTQCNRKLKKLFPKNGGLVHLVRSLVASKTEYNPKLLNVLLRPI